MLQYNATREGRRLPYYLFIWNEEIEEYLACVYELLDETTVLPVTAYEVEG